MATSFFLYIVATLSTGSTHSLCSWTSLVVHILWSAVFVAAICTGGRRDIVASTASRLNPVYDAHQISALEGLGLNVDQPSFEIQYLRQFVLPLPSMQWAVGHRPGHLPPITLGLRADTELVNRGASGKDFLRVFRARVHAPTRDVFSSHLSRATGWTVIECDHLWDLIELPDM